MNGNGNGAPIAWKDSVIHWVSDTGPLSSRITNEEAVSWVNEIFSTWAGVELSTADGGSVKAVNLSVSYDGDVGYDVDLSNYIKASSEAYLKAVVIFDPEGEIVDKEFGAGSHKYIIGFAAPMSSNGVFFTGGVVVINGYFIGNGPKKVSENKYKAALLHEAGHLLNLDHTQANISAAKRVEDGDISLVDEIPTMYPILYSEHQFTPHADDVIALAMQYPSDEYKSAFCEITGSLIGSDGGGFQGANMEAHAKDAAFEYSDARTFVSGVMYPAGTKSGEYVLGGIVPGREYVVGYSGIDPSFVGGSSIEPYDPPLSDIVPTVINLGYIACSSGGVEGALESARVDPVPTTGANENAETVEEGGGGGGCSLVR